MTHPDYFRAPPDISLLTSISSRGYAGKVNRLVDADHYSWEEVYDLLGCEPEIEPAVEY